MSFPGRANFMDPAPAPRSWNYSIQDNGRALAYYPGDVSINGNVIISGDGDIQGAIDAANARGGGLVIVGQSANVATSLILKTGVYVDVAPGVILTWTGGADFMWKTANDNVTNYCGLSGYGATFACGASAAGALRIYSTWKSQFQGFRVTSNSATNVILDIRGDASGGTGPAAGRHTAYCTFVDILSEGYSGTLCRLYGVQANSGYVTLNSFYNVCSEANQVRGFDFAQWCDSNTFSGKIRVNLAANNAVGAEFNTADPTNNVGVYNIVFESFAVDTFAGPTGRKAVQLNNCKDIFIYNLFNTPVAEGGVVNTTVNTGCYEITLFDDATNSIRIYGKSVSRQGTGTNDNAPAGFIGEYMEHIVGPGSAVALTTDTPATVCTLALTPGDWDVRGTGLFAGNAATTIVYLLAGISDTAAFDDNNYTHLQRWFNNAISTFIARLPVTARRFSVSSAGNNSVQLICQAGFGLNTLGAYGILTARRVR